MRKYIDLKWMRDRIHGTCSLKVMSLENLFLLFDKAPSVGIDLAEDGTLSIEVEDATKVKRVLVEDGKNGDMYYGDMYYVGRPQGEWILTSDEQYEYCTCSNCGYENGENWAIGSEIPFCAMCGATHKATHKKSNERPTTDQQPTTSKEDKNIRSTTTHSKGHPKLDEIKTYVEENNLIIDAEYFYKYYETAGWVDNKGKPIKNWKLKALNWNKREEERNDRPEKDDARRSGQVRTGMERGSQGSGENSFSFTDSI